MENFRIESKNKVFPFIWYFLKKYKISFFLTAILCASCMSVAVLGSQYFLKLIIDSIAGNNYTFNSVVRQFLFFCFFNYSDYLVDIAIVRIYYNIEAGVQNDIRDAVFQHIIKHSIVFFNNNQTGSLVSKINDLADGACNIIDQSLNSLQYIILFIITMAIFTTQSLLLACVFLILMIIYSIIFIPLSNKSKKLWKDHSVNFGKLVGNVSDCLASASVVKSFSREKYEKCQNKKQLLNIMSISSKAYYLRGVVKFVNFISYFIIMFTIGFISLKLFMEEKITLGTLTLIIATADKLIVKLKQLFDCYARCFECYGKVQQALEILMVKREICDLSHNKLVIKNGNVDIKNIYFKYNEKQDFVFNNFSLSIPTYQKLGIVGYSGAGKTTLVNLLLRFYDVNKGGIYIDGQNIKTDVSQESLRNNISYIPQDPILFHRSIKDNILYGNLKATDEEIIEATKKANCFEFINKLENGFDTLVGERGVKLSGGQRQRIAIARAILKNSKILILDEATSALDSITENEIQKALANLMENKTVVVIAHRLSTLNIMDRIVVLDKGQIKEDGTKEELLKIEDGLFKKMWDMQKEGVIEDKEN